MATKPTKKESRTRTPPEKKKLKCSEHSMLTFQEEAEPSIKIWENRSEIQELAIKPEDLIKTHLPRSTEEQQVYPRESHILIRKCNDKVEKNANLLVAHQQCPEYAARDALFSGLEIPLMDNYGEILPHHVLGTLQELNREAASPGNTLVPELLAESMNQNLAFGSQIEKRGLGQRKPSDEQDLAINNWQHHMTLRKKQLDSLSRHLNKPLGKLLMNTYEDLWPLEEKRRMIRQSSSATESCKGMRSQKEFWNMPEHIGDDFSGLLLTLTKSERGYALPSVHVGKAKNILLETGLVDKPLIHSTRDKRPRLQQCQYAEGAAMEEIEHSKLEIDNLEVVGRGKCFPYVAADSFGSSNEAEVTCPKENQDALHIFPDMPDIVLGPSLLFCGQQASWIEHTASHRDRVGICAHVTFEAHTGEKSSSTLEIVNNGSTAIWYEWRRLPSNVKLEGHHKAFQSQKFFFNTCTGVVLPGKTQVFPFHFKSTTAGVFMEDWEFCTHPVLLAGALLQVSLWGIALHEDKVSQLREALEKQLMAREAASVAQEIVWEMLEDTCTTDRPQSPLSCDAEEDLFNIVNPKTLECVPEDETREVLHFQFNVNISQSSLLPKEAAVDFLQEACIQLWREGIDNFVERSQFLRYISGMPEKNVHTEYPVEEAADKTHLKGSKEEKKGDKLKEEKGTPGGKEDKRGLKAESFSRTDKDVFSKNGKEEMKPLEPLGTNQDYNNLVPSRESFDLMGQQSHLFQEYPAFQEKYTESLYTEVYGLLLSMVRNLVIIAESLEPRRFVSEPDNMNPNN